MKSLQKILWWLLGFYLIMTVVYTIWTVNVYGHPEWVGVVTLALMAMFSVFIGFYMGVENKPFKMRLLPEDRLDGNIEDAEEELGQFSPWSYWPILLAATVGFVLVGISVGWWPVFFIAPLLLWALVGWSMEYYRGHLRH